MKSRQPRKQRRYLHTAPLHRRRKMMAAHLSDELYARYGVRSVPVRKGDIVEVMRGSFRGHRGKVLEVDLKKMRISVEGVTVAKADETMKPYWIHPSNVRIVKLDLSDVRRKEKLEAIAASRIKEEVKAHE